MADNGIYAEIGLTDPRTSREVVMDAAWDIPAPDLGALSESMYYTNRGRRQMGLEPLSMREVYKRSRRPSRWD